MNDTHDQTHQQEFCAQSADSNVDLREQLANDAQTGPIERVSLPEAMITRLNGILLDIDPGYFRPTIFGHDRPRDVETLYEKFIAPMLARHEVLAGAEVRHSGTGLHVVIRFAEPVKFESGAERERWAGIVRVVQRLLPTDPGAPGITAMTRPLESVNSKNGERVRELREPTPVSPQQVWELYEQVRARPLRTIASILFGAERVTPCPVCRKPDTSLAAMDRAGRCYGSCGKVKLGQLYDVFLGTPAKRKEG